MRWGKVPLLSDSSLRRVLGFIVSDEETFSVRLVQPREPFRLRDRSL